MLEIKTIPKCKFYIPISVPKPKNRYETKSTSGSLGNIKIIGFGISAEADSLHDTYQPVTV